MFRIRELQCRLYDESVPNGSSQRAGLFGMIIKEFVGPLFVLILKFGHTYLFGKEKAEPVPVETTTWANSVGRRGVV